MLIRGGSHECGIFGRNLTFEVSAEISGLTEDGMFLLHFLNDRDRGRYAAISLKLLAISDDCEYHMP
ncbi:hypothetical protein ACFPN2_38180 [Steroidobacter flavus]|uniref:Uncharacterized protein n=1 Tax=Steroidobacter flavus TaxID=1842136 RepID=A0ABV8T579_9GAMM